MSPNFIADQIQKHIWTIASMLNSNYGAFCCTPLAFRRLWIAARLNALWKQRRGMGECRAMRGWKVRKKEWKRNEMHRKKGHNQGVWTKKKGKRWEEKGNPMVGKLSNICKKRQRNRSESWGRWLTRKIPSFLHHLTPSPCKHLHLPRLTLWRQASSPTARPNSPRASGQQQLSLGLSATTYCPSLLRSHAIPPAPWLPILPNTILLCWQKTTSFPWAINPWADALHSGS